MLLKIMSIFPITLALATFPQTAQAASFFACSGDGTQRFNMNFYGTDTPLSDSFDFSVDDDGNFASYNEKNNKYVRFRLPCDVSSALIICQKQHQDSVVTDTTVMRIDRVTGDFKYYRERENEIKFYVFNLEGTCQKSNNKAPVVEGKF